MFFGLFSQRKRRVEREQLSHLISFGWKRLRQDRDLLTDKQQASFRRETQKAQNALTAEAPDLPRASEELVRSYERTFPPMSASSWRENGEVILVALVVAMAVRAFFLQPFKIPTGSMQPTLNGITVRAAQPHEKTWWYGLVALPIFGERVVHCAAQSDGKLDSVRPVQYGPLHYGGRRGFLNFLPMEATEITVGSARYAIPLEYHKFNQDVLSVHNLSGKPLLDRDRVYKKGETILDLVVQTGDQLFVDRFTYNFCKPSRGDVFVFETKGIPVPSPGEFYIKRLAGVPGDTLQIKDPDLWVNGSVIAEPVGFQRVMSQTDGYRGYTSKLSALFSLAEPKTLGIGEYVALGDNSYASSDSRFWGPVPYKNIVGRGFFVYWPFTRHFGRVE